ncbi:creatininase family protein [Rhodoferax sp.]|uniref:creatininase family protein n=1 Tax=Rhodoferax sp. TaxID=50421 RepID=UPI00374DC63E
MKISEMNWVQVEKYLENDDRAVVPLGSTEQHAFLSLSVDSILSERVAVEAAQPLGVPVFPALAYGITPYFMAYPGTVSLKTETYQRILTDVLDSLRSTGFRRILLVNGHGGNAPGLLAVKQWLEDNPDCSVRLHNWWNAPLTLAQVKAIDPVASHASWMENFSWTRLPGVEQPDFEKPMVDIAHMRTQGPAGVRETIGDGNFGGRYQRSDEDMAAVWSVAVAETRALIETW